MRAEGERVALEFFHVYDSRGHYLGRDGRVEPADLGDLPMERGADDDYDLVELVGGPLNGTWHIILNKGTTWFNESDADVQAGLLDSSAPQPPLTRDPEWPDLPQEC